jgi:hypothetical protein
MLLEKAWAKTFLNYVKAEAMCVDHAMEDLLGAPAEGYWTNETDAITIFNRI